VFGQSEISIDTTPLAEGRNNASKDTSDFFTNRTIGVLAGVTF